MSDGSPPTGANDSPDEQLPPYVIEGARSSRSRCKTCRRKIDKDTLRIGVLIEGPYGTGYLWHHLRCAARRQFEKVEEAYGLEAWKEAKQPPRKVPNLDSLKKLREKAEEKRKERKTIPYTEPAPSGRASCKHCGETIEKASMRVILGREVEFGGVVRIGPINVHPHCVAKEMQADDCGTEADGFAERLLQNSRDQPEERIRAVLAEIGDI